MREIEFRAKSIGGEWVYGVLMPFWNRDKEIKMYCIIPYNIGLTKDTSIWEIQIQVDPDTIGQFTGKRDKNGKKIYEDDIIFQDNELLGVIYISDGYGISFDTEISSRRLVDCVLDIDFESGLLSGIEVKGNIHDTPELLKGGEE